MPIVDGQEMKNVKQLIEKLTADPSLGHCTLRAEATWDGNFTSKVIPVPGFKGSGGECLYAEDLLELLAKCITFDTLGFGDHQGLKLNRVRTYVEGDINFAGSVGLDAPAAFRAIRVAITADGDGGKDARNRLISTVRAVSVLGQSLAAVSQHWTIDLPPVTA